MITTILSKACPGSRVVTPTHHNTPINSPIVTPARGRSRTRSVSCHSSQGEPVGEPGDPDDGDDGDDGNGGGGGGGGGDPGDPGGPGGPFNPPDDVNAAMKDFYISLRDSLTGLGTAIGNLKSDGSDSGKTKVKDPEPFDGSDPRKLKTFLVSLSLVFIDRPNYFTEQRKVNYTLSYLTSSAREWFEPDILDPNLNALPAWNQSFSALVQELQDQFGLYDAEGEAEEKIGSLRMKENDQIRKYNIRFNTLASMVNWDANALRWAYQRGLASRIKDELARIPEPRTLADYCREVNRIDNRYWRREEEKKRDANRSSGNTGGNKNTNQNKKGSNNPPVHTTTVSTSVSATPTTQSNSNHSSNKRKKNNGFNTSQGISSASSVSRAPRPYDKYLGPDGKLKPEELERRKKAGLCTFCGGKHTWENCDQRKQNNSGSRARAATTQEPKSELSVIAEVPEN